LRHCPSAFHLLHICITLLSGELPPASRPTDRTQIASLERQIKDANSDARRAPLIAQLNALRGGGYSAPSAAAVKPSASSYSSSSFSATPRVADKEVASKIASLERQIKDANSDARRAPLIAQLNSLRNNSSYSAPQSYHPPAAAAKPASPVVAASSFSASPVADKEVAAKIAALERQIKDANSDARKAPLIAQLNSLRNNSSYSAPQPPTAAATKPAAPRLSPMPAFVAPSPSARAISPAR